LVEASSGVVREYHGTWAVLEAVTAGPEGGWSQQSSGRSPQRGKVFAVGWLRWLLAVALLGSVTGHTQGDDGGT
jgi:hypothetical protein